MAKRIKMLRSRGAPGLHLEAGEIYGDEVRAEDKAILVRMGSAEYVEPEKKTVIIKFDKRSKVDDIKGELKRREIPFDEELKKDGLLELLPDEVKA